MAIVLFTSVMCDDSQVTDDCKPFVFFDEDSLPSDQVKYTECLSCLAEKRTLIHFTITPEIKDLPCLV
jgi:uncharacterized protein YegL